MRYFCTNSFEMQVALSVTTAILLTVFLHGFDLVFCKPSAVKCLTQLSDVLCSLESLSNSIDDLTWLTGITDNNGAHVRQLLCQFSG